MKITQTPLASLRSESSAVLHRVRDVVTEDVKELLSSTTVIFVIAEVGKPLRWISEEERFRFWKSDARVHIATEEKSSLENSPDGYFYFASEWRSEACNKAFILLEKYH